MTTLEDHRTSDQPAGSSPETIEDLIPEVRQRARRRRLRNLVVVLLVGALAAGLIAVTGSHSPATHRTGGAGAPSSLASTPAERTSVVPEQPASLAVGPNGELYLADIGRDQILRRLQDGRFVVVAGTGVAGYTGDGGPATRAEIDFPGSLAVASSGAVYFAQTARTKTSSGPLRSVVREVTPDGGITTVIGQDPSCATVPSTSIAVPARSAELSGAWLTIGSHGLLDVSTTVAVCPNILHVGSFLQLTSSGELVRTSADSIPLPAETSQFCWPEVPGSGFIAFSCSSGAGRGPRLMVVRSNGSTENYPEYGELDAMSASNGTVVAIRNGAIVRVGLNGLATIATQRQLANLVPGALGWPGVGIAIDREGTVYVDQDFIIGRHGCADVIFQIGPRGQIRKLWRSARTNSCY
jgi:hypothetical protein